MNPDAAEEDMADVMDDPVPSVDYERIPLVGLGGSAGSIEVLKEFFPTVQPDSGLAYAVVIHLSPDHESSLADLIQRCTAMPVIQVRGQTEVRADHVYVIPPGKSLKATKGRLELGDLVGDHARNVAVDIFFRTLADTHGPRAAAIVISGVDGDGAIGVKRMKERGGLTIAQDPDEAAHSGMPNSAVATGMVDWVLPVREMAARLRSYFSFEKKLRLPPEEGPQPAAPAPESQPHAHDETALRDVLALLRRRTGRDFNYYKRATILRRVGRRMQVNGIDNLAGYLECMRTRPGESAALLQDLLISVTNFFRDPECFRALEAVVPSLFEGKGPGDTLRVWVAACATGEEAYSVAMLLSEHARTLDAPPAIQIFATDLDEDSIRAAREGLFPTAMEADVDPDRLKRYFTKESRGYRVRRELREMVLFAFHDALKDSPFSRLDLITCRNLLIYLNREAQERVIETFQFALLPQGKLFLGSSESVEESSPLFSVVDKKYRIYAQRPAPRPGMPVAGGRGPLSMIMDLQNLVGDAPVIPVMSTETSPIRPRVSDRGSSWAEVHLRMLELLAPPSILVDNEHDIVHLSPSAGRFLQFGGGEPSRNLLRAVHEGVRIPLRASLYQAAQSRSVVDVPGVPIELGGKNVNVKLRVMPAAEHGLEMFLVTMDPRPVDEPPAEDGAKRDEDPIAQHLERELERMKSYLRDTVEQYEASNEELKASNEELQAMNEELRSATEELETSREELQSINEELTTVNQEMKSKVEELGRANADMHNLMDATATATVFLDRELRITRYTPSAVTMFNLIPTDLGRPLTNLTNQLAYSELEHDAQRVLSRLVPVEREVGQSDGSWFLARLLPYRTLDDRIAGVVLSFVNITERKQAEEARLWMAAVMKATPDAIISFSLDGTILSWNESAERIFGFTAKDAIGQGLELVAPGQTKEQRSLVTSIAAGTPTQHHMAVRRREDGREIHVSISAAPIADSAGNVIAGTAIIRDVTELRTNEREMGVLREALAKDRKDNPQD